MLFKSGAHLKHLLIILISDYPRLKPFSYSSNSPPQEYLGFKLFYVVKEHFWFYEYFTQENKKLAIQVNPIDNQMPRQLVSTFQLQIHFLTKKMFLHIKITSEY